VIVFLLCNRTITPRVKFTLLAVTLLLVFRARLVHVRWYHTSQYLWQSVVKITAGLPVVLKFQRCPEIRNCPEILLIWSECPEIDLCYAVVMALPLFCTWYLFNWTLSVLLAYLLTTILPYVHYSFMCNIALVTFFELQYWSASMSNFYEHIKRAFSVSWASWNRQKCPEIF